MKKNKQFIDSLMFIGFIITNNTLPSIVYLLSIESSYFRNPILSDKIKSLLYATDKLNLILSQIQ
jgi:hypothetical protein